MQDGWASRRVHPARVERLLTGLLRKRQHVPMRAARDIVLRVAREIRECRCPVCGRRFGNRGVLARHIYVTRCGLVLREVLEEAIRLAEEGKAEAFHGRVPAALPG